MPEEPEVDTERLNEAVREELEHEGGAFLRRIALTTALLAALASVASLRAGDTANEALVQKAEATRFQAEASDQWAYYQAKGIKAAVQEAARGAWLAIGKQPPTQYDQSVARYGEEQKEIQERAREKEKQRDEHSREADELLARHHAFASAVAFFQVAIALGAVAALTHNRPVWLLSLVVGGVGAVLSLTRLLS
jgi:hypothetical protein